MGYEDKEGSYCTICGGISPAKITTKQIEIDGKLIGIDGIDEIISEVRGLGLSDDAATIEELLKRVKKSNYVPSSKSKEYGEALLKEYKDKG